MRRFSPLIWLLLLPLLACLEPGPTPLGPQSSDLDPPGELLVYEPGITPIISVRFWEEELPLYDPEMLYCGDDRVLSGFKAEPIWSFDLSAAEEFEPYITGATFIVDLPPASWIPEGSSEELVGDNPDLDRNIRVDLMSFDTWPGSEEILTSLDGLSPVDATGAGPYAVDEDIDTQFAIPISRELTIEWLEASANGDSLNLAFQLPISNDSGLLRLYSLSSQTPAGEDATPARLVIDYFIDESKSETIYCAKNGQALSRIDPVGAGEISLATGMARFTQLSVFLPDSLRADDLMVMRARLYLCPDSASIIGAGVQDRDSGGLTLRALALNEEFDVDAPEYNEDDNYGLVSALDLFDGFGDPLNTITIPLTTWVQEWMQGDRENHGIVLALNGRDERPRSFSFFLDEPGKDPRLEIIYARRPDFE
ncbi:hypothetical protein H8E52_07585 [bacterium]|nr:hypothetical protein [bacterium]